MILKNIEGFENLIRNNVHNFIIIRINNYFSVTKYLRKRYLWNFEDIIVVSFILRKKFESLLLKLY